MQVQNDISLKPYNSFAIDAKARRFAGFKNLDELLELLNHQESFNDQQLILGGGSNILFTSDFNGLVLKNEISGIEILKEDEEHVYIKAGAGESWHKLVMYCVEHDYAGIENLSLIPGSVGASPMQNIGAYGVEIKDVFHELEAFHIHDRIVQKFSLTDCEFGYRDSVFKNKYRGQFVITSVTYRLNKHPVYHTSYGAIQQELERMEIERLTVAAISKAVINIRSSKLPDPKEIGNAGSFFKNILVSNAKYELLKKAHAGLIGFPSGETHTKLAAGWLIEQCGWKGYRKNDAGCYPKQALLLVNYGNASGREILELSEEIIHSVQKKFDVLLEREVNII